MSEKSNNGSNPAHLKAVQTSVASKPAPSKPAPSTPAPSTSAPSKLAARPQSPMPTVAAVPPTAVIRPVIEAVKATPVLKADGVAVKKTDFTDRVVEESGLKKSDVKPALDAILSVLAKALESGDSVQLPPLGKLKVQSAKDVGGGATAYTLKLRTPKRG